MGGKRQYDGVRAASESTIEIDFYYAGKRCRERIKLEPTPANLKRAAQHRAAVLDAIARGVFDYATTFPGSTRAKKLAKEEGQVQTIGQYLEDWLAAKAPSLKRSTAYGYRKIIFFHLIPTFGDRPLGSLTRPELKLWAAQLKVSNKSLANIFSCFRSALKEAFEDGLIDANPLYGWTYRRQEGPQEKSEVDPFTIDEQAAILAALNGQGRNLVQFAFWTGMRTSELAALDWGDIDWQRDIAHVRRGLTQASKGKPESPKTKAGTREVRLLAPALEALVAQKAYTYLKGQEVFQNPNTGTRWMGDGAIRQTLWVGALKRAKVRYRYPYQTRHTYASMMLSAGEHPMWVAQQMGHKDWGMIRRVYGRWMQDMEQRAGSKAVEQFARKKADQKADHTTQKNPKNQPKSA